MQEGAVALPKFDPQRDQPDLARVTASELDDALARARTGERVVVHGDDARPVAAIVPIADLRRLEDDDVRRDQAIAALREFGEAFAHLEQEEIEREAVKAVREARAELYAERLKVDDLRRAAAVAGLYHMADRFRELDAEETDRQAQEAVDAIRAGWRDDAAARS
jgi:antitoxin (DNA-binding transcriptional repressor) of toxin-antitoxin stability system